MRRMPRLCAGAAALALAALAASAEAAPGGAAVPVLYERPPAPDCAAMAARHGAQRLWFGAISGWRHDVFWDRRYPHYAEGCFLSERACRSWLHENLSFMQGGSLNWMRCEPGVPARMHY